MPHPLLVLLFSFSTASSLSLPCTLPSAPHNGHQYLISYPAILPLQLIALLIAAFYPSGFSRGPDSDLHRPAQVQEVPSRLLLGNPYSYTRIPMRYRGVGKRA